MNARCMDHRMDRWGGHRRSHPYPGQVLARVFGYVAIAALIYAAALVAVAVHSRILEF